MPDRRHRMVKHHPRAGPAHDGADALLHVFAVAVDGTLLACGFVLAEFAAVQPLEGVIQKFGAPAAEFFVPAIHSYHQSDNFLFFRQSVVCYNV